MSYGLAIGLFFLETKILFLLCTIRVTIGIPMTISIVFFLVQNCLQCPRFHSAKVSPIIRNKIRNCEGITEDKEGSHSSRVKISPKDKFSIEALACP